MRSEKKVNYRPDVYKDECINKQKEGIDGLSPGSLTERGLYIATKCQKMEDYPECKKTEYKNHLMEDTLRNTIKGTDDTGTDNEFSQDSLDFTGNIKKEETKSPKRGKQQNTQAYRLKNIIF